MMMSAFAVATDNASAATATTAPRRLKLRRKFTLKLLDQRVSGCPGTCTGQFQDPVARRRRVPSVVVETRLSGRITGMHFRFNSKIRAYPAISPHPHNTPNRHYSFRTTNRNWLFRRNRMECMRLRYFRSIPRFANRCQTFTVCCCRR